MRDSLTISLSGTHSYKGLGALDVLFGSWSDMRLIEGLMRAALVEACSHLLGGHGSEACTTLHLLSLQVKFIEAHVALVR